MDIIQEVKPRRLFEEPEHVERFIAVKDLREYMEDAKKTAPCMQPGFVFKPLARYVRAMDAFDVLWKESAFLSRRMGDLEVYVDPDTGEIGGVRFYGVLEKMNLREVTDGDAV